MNKAYKEYERTRSLRAFNINGATRKQINQYLTQYIFDDNSILSIYDYSNKISCGKDTRILWS